MLSRLRQLHLPFPNIPSYIVLLFFIPHALFDTADDTGICICDVVQAIELRHSARLPTMTIPSRSQIIQFEPIGDGLDAFRRFLNSKYKDISASNALNPLSKGNIDELSDIFTFKP